MSLDTMFEDSIDQKLTTHDCVIVNQSDLADFFTAVGGVDKVPADVMILSDDDTTKGGFEFNLITSDNDDYGIATQLHHPTKGMQKVLDLRRNVNGTFAEYLMDLME